VVWITNSLVWFAQLRLKDENQKGTSSFTNNNGNKLNASPSRRWPLESTCPVYDMVVPCFGRESPTCQCRGYYSDGNFAVLELFILLLTTDTNRGSLYFIQIMGVLWILGVGIILKETFLSATIRLLLRSLLPWSRLDINQYKFILREQPCRVHGKYKLHAAVQRKVSSFASINAVNKLYLHLFSHVMLLSRHQNAGQSYDIKIANRCFENVAKFRFLGNNYNKSKPDSGGH
jgi:hypothetical protein